MTKADWILLGVIALVAVPVLVVLWFAAFQVAQYTFGHCSF